MPLRPVLAEVWTFGLVQLGGLVAANLAGWWLITLVARSDTSLVQMSFLAIGSQLRNIVGLPPSLLTESSYAVLADPSDESGRTPQQVMAMCTFASATASLLLAASGILLLPWVLQLLYGKTYGSAATAVAIALAIAVAHMGNAPAAARLSIVSIRLTGVINTIWAVAVGAAASLLLLRHGSAAAGMLIFFAAHVLSAGLVLLTLRRLDRVPRGMISVSSISVITAACLALLAARRQQHPEQVAFLTAVMFLMAALALLLLARIGRQHHWLPTRQALRQLLNAARVRLRSASPTGASHA